MGIDALPVTPGNQFPGCSNLLKQVEMIVTLSWIGSTVIMVVR
jgi:hypothetical protein